jgi:tRNA pseudouridine55 synthase
MARVASPSYFGFLNINKPAGITAHDVVAIVRKTLGCKQVGHGGTLDPMATGVLPVAVGKATRLLRFLPSDKTYLAEIRFGLTTDTDDITGTVISSSNELPSQDAIVAAANDFRGEIRQLPPMYSAVHVGGKRLYELARQGKAPDTVPEREVTVHKLEILSYEPPNLNVRIACSAGTYIRSIARDLGQQLSCGGCLSSLVREQAGLFSLDDAVSLDVLKEKAAVGETRPLFSVPQNVLPLEKFEIDSSQAQHLIQGRAIDVPVFPNSGAQDYVLALKSGKLVAVCRVVAENSSSFVKMQPEVVLADDTNTND